MQPSLLSSPISDTSDMSHPKSVELLARLIAFDTVSDRSNLDIVDFIANYLDGFGIPSRRFPNAAGDKAALLATIGPSDRPGLVLSGHLDVVPVTGQPWSHSPFQARIADGRLYGRGAADMKGFVAVALALVPRLASARLDVPVHLAFSYDEEITCKGSLDLIGAFGRDLAKPAGCLVGEPTLMAVVNAHKSVAAFETTVTGLAGHSSRPEEGANAVIAAAKLALHLETLADDLRQGHDLDGRFQPPYTSLSIGKLGGGIAFNTVPDRASLIWETRGLPNANADDLVANLHAFAESSVLPALRRQTPAASVTTAKLIDVPSLAALDGSRLERLAVGLLGGNAPQTAAYGTEAGHFAAAGIPAIVCGPGSIGQAHKADEWIALEQLILAERFVEALLTSWSVA